MLEASNTSAPNLIRSPCNRLAAELSLRFVIHSGVVLGTKTMFPISISALSELTVTVISELTFSYTVERILTLYTPDVPFL